MLPKIKNFLLVNTSLGQTLVKNTFWLFVGELTSRLLKMVLIIYAARILGVANWGIFAYAISIASLFFLFSDLGLDNLVTREIAKNFKERLSYFATAFVFRLVLLPACGILIFIFLTLFSKIPEVQEIIFIVAVFLALDLLRGFGLAFHRAFEQMEKEAFVKFSTNLSISVLGLLVLFTVPSLKNLAYAYLAGSSLGLLITIYTLRKYLSDILKSFSLTLVGQIWRITWPFFIAGVAAAFMTYTDMMMIGWWKTPMDLGLYSAAQRLIQFLFVAPSLIAVATFPLLSKLAEESPVKLKAILGKTISLVLLLGLPIALGGILLGREIMLIAFGEAYVGATLVFQIFLGGILATFPLVILNNYIFIQNLQKKLVVWALGSALLNVFLNYLFIPRFGIAGAALATTLSGFALAIVVWQIIGIIGWAELFSGLKKIILSSVAMVIITLTGKYWSINVFLNIGLSALFFFMILALLKEPLVQEFRAVIQNKEPV
ncbi:MAG: Membrane protein involved in the export of O-antigen and teichoic acid [Candidatus Nomurabacteria bacterium GW2011_GWB1_47_6]|uniref:Membrane protein involved in the export of O-antigen and teichoic acid n=1 Tax=Candidatus Nomurabacteria bacterium GW2011_GWB1_47_6 TaxID=1618749 RepID=A0A0G1VCK2_9BACT|nr:MAG: Membrane protein involved in the export of O-antigen and teichoic acid [Candidatus Nomurabacteria bacterium GW2011_GWB1_47_6]